MKLQHFFHSDITCFSCLDDADTKNKKMKDTNTEKLKGTHKKKRKQHKDMTLYRSLALIPTDAKLLITWSRNPQLRLRSDLGKPK